MNMLRKALLLVFGLGSITLADAAELPSRSYIPLEMANRAVMTAVAVCKKNGDPVTATFVDGSGLVRAVEGTTWPVLIRSTAAD
jgi:hypothetical protein